MSKALKRKQNIKSSEETNFEKVVKKATEGYNLSKASSPPISDDEVESSPKKKFQNNKKELKVIKIDRSARDQNKLIKRLNEHGQNFDLTDFLAAEVLANTKKIVFKPLNINRGRNGVERFELPEYRNIKIDFSEFEDFCSGICLISEYLEELKHK